MDPLVVKRLQMFVRVEMQLVSTISLIEDEGDGKCCTTRKYRMSNTGLNDVNTWCPPAEIYHTVSWISQARSIISRAIEAQVQTTKG